MKIELLNKLIPFAGKFGTVRGYGADEELWFAGKDIAAALGYANPSKAIWQHVDKDNKRTVSINNDPSCPYSACKITLINEAGVYELIFGSTIPAAEAFKDWVCDEVLPSIRKYGCYPPPACVLRGDTTTARLLEELYKSLNNNTEVLL